MRTSNQKRRTNETDITLELNLDGTGKTEISTGVGFFDHMLTALGRHSGFDLSVNAKGDLDVDGHHTIEDVGIVLGQAFKEAIGDKVGITRYGTATIPMDEALAQASIDISGRAYLVFDADFSAGLIGALDTQMIAEFFRAFATNAEITLHINLLYGENDHHRAEAIFKAFAHALKKAAKVDGDTLLSTKGTL
ncbi:MAG: imidazoleglycerol-phosphate dehydratase HisB [Clostridiales Family XIII bacterium]|jgi:imidazoleglycerol-phosphate dehydratase|nr:imidazoleglycerol-phosphate dehydratase HisB [Clostridiales Family XIII bacterium]